MPSRAISAGGRPASSSPFSVIEPDAGGAMPVIVFSAVDLPAPLRPRRATISCRCTSKPTSVRMWLLP
jgi:hypothetical protein